jgi:predicted metal-dependent HD superfamily phosphohydrolase
MIKAEFLNSLKNGMVNNQQQQALWNEVEAAYTSSGRYYHTLSHLDHMLEELSAFKDNFADWDTVVFALVYHDLVYDPLKHNNEEESAEHARKRLSTINFPIPLKDLCVSLILATKKHEGGSSETNLFTDADLSILGADATTYNSYSDQIRLEYAAFPDDIYRVGRKRVLLHFLEMPRIYKSREFFSRYESRARSNLERELQALS